MWARLAFGGIPVARGLCLVRVFGKEGQEEIERLDSLPAGGFLQAAQDAVIFQPARSAGAVDDFAQNDDRAQTALGLVIGRGYLGSTEAGEEVFLLRAQEALASSGVCSTMDSSFTAMTRAVCSARSI